eukprot:1967812-Rhodomonas_salina.1
MPLRPRQPILGPNPSYAATVFATAYSVQMTSTTLTACSRTVLTQGMLLGVRYGMSGTELAYGRGGVAAELGVQHRARA